MHPTDPTIKKIIAKILSYSLIERTSNHSAFSIQSFIHTWLKERLDVRESKEKLLDAVRLTGQSVSYEEPRRFDHWAFKKRIVLHLQVCWQHTREYLQSKPPMDKVRDFIGNLSWIAHVFYELQYWREAEEIDTRMVTLCRNYFGESDLDTLKAMTNLAMTLHKQERFNEAEELQVKVLPMEKEVLGESHPDTLTSMACLAGTLYSQRRFSEAEELDIKVLPMRKEVLGESHPDTLQAMENLAITLSARERWKEAAELCTRLVAISKETLGEVHPSTVKRIQQLEDYKEAQLSQIGQYSPPTQLQERLVLLLCLSKTHVC